MLNEKDVAKKLIEINAIKLNPDTPFTWASGLRSPIYCDNRTVLSFPAFRTEVKKALSVKAKKEFAGFDKVAGVATAGIAHGALIADELDLPFIYVRSKPKGHGRQNQIEGILNPGEKCLVVEDLISTGGSSIQAVEVLREAGAEVVGVIAIFSYVFDSAQKNFAAADCPYTTISDYHALMAAMTEEGTFSQKQLSSLREWRQDPKAWSEKFELKNL